MKRVTASEKAIALVGLTTSSLLFLYQVNSFFTEDYPKSSINEAQFARLLRKYEAPMTEKTEKTEKTKRTEETEKEDISITPDTHIGDVFIRYRFDFPFEGALNHLIHEEGIQDRAYRDSRGISTIGIGHNLKANPICKGSIKAQFLCNLNMAEEGAKRFVGSEKIWASMGEYRRLAIVSMVFQMGIGELMTWHKTREAIRAEDWKLAALRASQSKWARDSFQGTPARAKRVCQMLADNKLILRDGHPEYAWENLTPKQVG